MARFGFLILQYEWVILVLMLPLVLFPTPERAWILLLIPLLWILRKGLTGHFLTATPLNWQIYMLWVMIGVSLVATFDFAHSLEKIAGLIYATAVFFALVAWVGHSTRRLWLGVTLIILAGAAIAALAVLIVRMPVEFPILRQVIDRLPQMIWTIPGRDGGINPNEVAGALLWSLPLSLVLLVALLGKPREVLKRTRPLPGIVFLLALGGLTLFMSFVLLLSQSRGAILGLILSLIVVFMVLLAHRSIWLFWASLAVGLILVAAFLAFGNGEQVATILFPQVGLKTGDGTAPGLASRLEIWHRATLAIQDFPLTGMGMNNFRIVAPELYPFFIFPSDADFGHAHNQWLQTALDLGLPGLVAYVALWLGIGFMLWHSWRQAADYWSRALLLGFTAVVSAYFVYGLVDAVALGARPGFLWWFLLGLITSLHMMMANHGSVTE